MRILLVAVALAACSHPGDKAADAGTTDGSGAPTEVQLGGHYSPDGTTVTFRVASTRATRIELDVFAQPTGAAAMLTVAMTPSASGTAQVWEVTIPTTQLPTTIYYGYRAWGPNWTYDASWTPGSSAGWITDVDNLGNRMNPNKLLFDPYGLEQSHDPETPTQLSGAPYAVGSNNRATDSAQVAPKAIVLHEGGLDFGTKPTRAFKDDIVYEVHVRGLTAADPNAGTCAGTYAGAATRASYLASLGVTAVELMPVAETQNDTNNLVANSNSGDNYWGYSTLAYFAPDRHYACDQTAGGPTREFVAMVAAFHAAGLKVFVDVVYNHTAESSSSSLLSLRGLDNAGYYQLDTAGTGFVNSNGVGADVAAQKPLTAGLIIDSLRYWSATLGVDGFRFDLAPVLGNAGGTGAFSFDASALPATIAHDFARPTAGGSGVDLIAEPWAVANNSYELGKFPDGWSEWNGQFRDTTRQSQNDLGVDPVSPGGLLVRLSGSPDLYQGAGRPPASGVSYIISHDGFTLNDLYTCDAPNNTQAWPWGPSNGGTTSNYSWDQSGSATAQRQAVRTGMALELLAAGTPMIEGGDELGRTVQCNNNPYNLDSSGTWLSWSNQGAALSIFAQRMMQFRAAHAELRPATFGTQTYYDGNANVASAAYLADSTQAIIAWQVGDLYVAYNQSAAQVTVTLPAAPTGLAWYRVANTASFLESEDNIVAPGMEVAVQATYLLDARALLLLLAK